MLNKHPLKILWLDLETTGLDAVKNGTIQIAGILDVDTIAGAEFNHYVQPFPDDVIEESAMAVHGHDGCTIETFDDPAVVHNNLIRTFGNFVDKFDRSDKMYIGGQNPGFDRDFLKQFWEKNNDPYFGSWFDYHIIDLCSLSMAFHIKDIINLTDSSTGHVSVRLGNVAKAFGLEQKEPHDALDDIRLVRQIFYEHMIDRFF